MKFAIEDSHRMHFQETGAIELVGLVSEEEASSRAWVYKSYQEQKLGFFRGTVPVSKYLKAGRDSWREKSDLFKQARSRGFSEVVFALTRTKPLRLGFTQVITSLEFAKFSDLDPAKSLFKTPQVLSETSSFQGIVCGCLTCLRPGEVKEDGVQPAVNQPGNTLFFSKDYPLDYQALLEATGGVYLLQVYLTDRAMYVDHPKDPLGSIPKQQGYFFGDRLKEVDYPVVFK